MLKILQALIASLYLILCRGSKLHSVSYHNHATRLQARLKDQEILEEGGGAGPSS